MTLIQGEAVLIVLRAGPAPRRPRLPLFLALAALLGAAFTVGYWFTVR